MVRFLQSHLLDHLDVSCRRFCLIQVGREPVCRLAWVLAIFPDYTLQYQLVNSPVEPVLRVASLLLEHRKSDPALVLFRNAQKIHVVGAELQTDRADESLLTSLINNLKIVAQLVQAVNCFAHICSSDLLTVARADLLEQAKALFLLQETTVLGPKSYAHIYDLDL